MASAPTVRTKPVTRDKLAEALKTPELIRAWENMVADVTEALPGAAIVNALAASLAQALAQAAFNEAVSANVAAQAAQATADTAVSSASNASVDPGLGLLHAELQALRARVAALEQGATA